MPRTSHSSGFAIARRWRTATFAVLVLGVWSAGAWQTGSRTYSTKGRPQLFLEDFAAYESLRAELEGVPEVFLLLENPADARLRRLPRGQIQKAQYTLAPVVVSKMGTPDVAVWQTLTMEGAMVVLHYFVTDAHRDQVEEWLRKTARYKGLTMSTRPVSRHLVVYRIERVGGLSG